MIQPIAFTSQDKKRRSIGGELMNVALKGGVAGAMGYVAGKYLIPVSDEYAETILKNGMVPHFYKEKAQKEKLKQPAAAKNKKSNTGGKSATEDAATHQSKTRVKTNFYNDAKAVTKKQIERIRKSFESYSKRYFKQQGGKEKLIKETRLFIKSAMGKGLGVLAAGIFAFAGIVDLVFRLNSKND